MKSVETERDPRCGESTGGLSAPEEGIWKGRGCGWRAVAVRVRPAHPRSKGVSRDEATRLAIELYHRPRRLRMASRISIFFAARRFEPLNSMG